MARIDFWHGVTILSIFLLVLFFIHIFGYLDEQTYDSLPLDSFLTEPSLVYMNYLIILIAFCKLLSFLFVICKSLDRQIMRFQPHCYRPYFPYHSTICLIPFILRQLYTTDNAADDVMYVVEWNRFFLVISSILQFIRSYWLVVIKERNLKRMGYRMFNTISRLIVIILFYFCCCKGLELLNRVNVSKEFMTVWSFFDRGSLTEDLNVNTKSTNASSFSLDQNLFKVSGKKLYRTMDSQSCKADDKMPYQQKTYFVGIGESVSLSCHANIKVLGTVSVLWFFNGRRLRSNDSTFNITTNVKKVFLKQEIRSRLEIDVIENNGFGNYACFFQFYEYIGEEKTFEIKKPFPSTKGRYHNKDPYSIKKKAFSSIRSIQHNIAQYSVKKHSGEKFFIYATLGGSINIGWKPMVFNNEIEDVIEYYYINGVPYHRSKEIGFCSLFSINYVFFGQTLNWFSVPRAKQLKQLYENRLFLETRFTECAGSSVFGVHTVEYFRRVNDRKSKSFVFQEVKHPDTLYVLPDFPYFFRICNATKEQQIENILKQQQLKLDYHLYESVLPLLWILRNLSEHLIFFTVEFLFGVILGLHWTLIDNNLQKVLTKMFFKEAPVFSADQSHVTYYCYVICGDTDRQSVNYNLVEPLRGKNIKTGFICDQCSINKSGRSKYDIMCDLLNQSEHLIFYITSSYLKDEKFNDIDLETVLTGIQHGFVSANKVLIINADNCKLPKKVLHNLPEAASDVQNWVTVKNPEQRINLILKWINSKNRCIVVSVAFV